MRCKENSCTSGLSRFPLKNSRQAATRFSTEKNPSKPWPNLIFLLNPPPYRVLPIIGRSVLIYKLWHEILDHISKKSRYTLGTKIDLLFIETLELLFIASYLSKQAKLPYLQKAVAKLDLLKFFLQISWEIKAMDTKKYISLSEKLDEIGKMLGGWIRGISIKENSAGKGGE